MTLILATLALCALLAVATAPKRRRVRVVEVTDGDLETLVRRTSRA